MVRRPCRCTRRLAPPPSSVPPCDRSPARERSLPIAVAAIVAVASMLAVMPSPTTGAVGSVSGRGQDIRLAVNGGLGRPAEDLVDAPESDRRRDRRDGRRRRHELHARSSSPRTSTPRPGPRCQAAEAVDFLDDGTHPHGLRARDQRRGWGGPDPALQGQVRRHPRHDRQQVRRVDDDPVVGEQAQVQGRPAHRPGPPDPARLRARRHGQGHRHARVARQGARRQAPRRSSSSTASTTRRSSSARSWSCRAPRAPPSRPRSPPRSRRPSRERAVAAAAVDRRPAASPAAAARATTAASSAGRSSVAATTSASTPTPGTSPSTSPRTTDLPSSPRPVAGWPSPAGSPTAAAGRCGSRTAAACTPRTTTWRACRSGNGQSVGRGQRVGRLGSSGWATGPHLHFEVWRGGMPWRGGSQVNPMRYF